MSGLKCSGCGGSIRYHGEPNGIELTAISQEMWNTFSSTDKPIICYLLDGNDDYFLIWRCPECGCLHAFEGYSPKVWHAYFFTDTAPDMTSARKYLIFSDDLFYDISEVNMTASVFWEKADYDSDNFFYALINENGIVTYRDEACTEELKRFAVIG